MHHLSENSGKATISDYPKKPQNKVFRCRNFQLDLSQRTYIMGILNVTPDSFFDGGKYLNLPSALRHIERMLEEGADIIDIGGESTRPGSLGVSEDEELRRVLPVIKEAVRRFNTILSIDTTKLNVAKAALEEGASIVNDISGLKFEPKIADLVAKHKAGLVVMHTPSRPYDMQEKTHYNSLIDDVRESLRASLRIAEEKGVAPESILVDPGFGFGKTASQNLLLLKHLREFESLGKPILVGTSRKSFIGKVLGTEDPRDRLEGTAATVAVAILNGASVIRVHDVLYMKRVATVVDAVLRAR
jgi:dihydropteroate synthase